MEDKNEASQIVRHFYPMVSTQFETKVKVIKSDNGGDFTSDPMKKFYAAQDILHQTSCDDIPQQMKESKRNIDIF